MVGFHDPDILHLEGSSPTPPLQAINIFLAVSAGLKQETRRKDIANAFLQGKPISRLLYCTHP